MEHLKFNGTEVTFLSKIKTQANVLCNQIPLIWRKNQALKDLAEKRKISPDLYQEIQKNFNGVLTQLKSDAQTLIEKSNEEISQCEKEMSALSYAVVNLELEHEIGQIDEESYMSAFEMLQENLKRVSSRKSDILSTKSKLSNLMLGDTPKIESATSLEQISLGTEAILLEKDSVDSDDSVVETETVDSDDSDTETINDENNSDEVVDLPEPPVVVYVKEVGQAGI